VHVGARVRLRRNMLAMSQEKLGEAIGLTFQQVQKYERGANRIGANRLYELSRILDVPVEFFFDATDPVQAPPMGERFAEPDRSSANTDPLQRGETVVLISAFHGIADPKIQRRVTDLAGELARKADGVTVQRRQGRRGKRRVPLPGINSER